MENIKNSPEAPKIESSIGLRHFLTSNDPEESFKFFNSTSRRKLVELITIYNAQNEQGIALVEANYYRTCIKQSQKVLFFLGILGASIFACFMSYIQDICTNSYFLWALLGSFVFQSFHNIYYSYTLPSKQQELDAWIVENVKNLDESAKNIGNLMQELENQDKPAQDTTQDADETVKQE